jgi:hypothetical protein
VDGSQPGIIHKGLGFSLGGSNATTHAQCRIILTGSRNTNSLAGHVLDIKPGTKQKGKVDDTKNQHKKDRKSQRKFNHRLGSIISQMERSCLIFKRMTIHKISPVPSGKS